MNENDVKGAFGKFLVAIAPAFTAFVGALVSAFFGG